MNGGIIALAGKDHQRTIRAAEQTITGLGGPFGVVGRAAGLGQEELTAGVPPWAWVAVGAVAGLTVGYGMRKSIERIIGR